MYVENENGSHVGKSVNSQEVTLDTRSLEAIRELIRSELDSSLAHLTKEITQLRSDNEMMKKVITSQQHQLEKMEIEKRACNLIINGLPEPSAASPDSQVVDNILESIRKNCSDLDPPLVFEVTKLHRMGKAGNGSKPRPIVITLPNQKYKDMVLKRSNCLRTGSIYRNVYLSSDLPNLTRMENGRLRTVFKRLKDSSPGSTVMLKIW